MHCLWINKPVSNWITTCSLIQTGNYSLEHGLGLDHLSKLKPLTKTHHQNIITSIFLLPDKSKKKRRSQHAKDQVELTLKVSQSTINLQEDGTEVLPEEEATSTKPVPEGTEDPLRIINSTHYNQDNTQPYPRNY